MPKLRVRLACRPASFSTRRHGGSCDRPWKTTAALLLFLVLPQGRKEREECLRTRQPRCRERAGVGLAISPRYPGIHTRSSHRRKSWVRQPRAKMMPTTTTHPGRLHNIKIIHFPQPTRKPLFSNTSAVSRRPLNILGCLERTIYTTERFGMSMNEWKNVGFGMVP
jgi:hypothetical protein